MNPSKAHSEPSPACPFCPPSSPEGPRVGAVSRAPSPGRGVGLASGNIRAAQLGWGCHTCKAWKEAGEGLPFLLSVCRTQRLVVGLLPSGSHTWLGMGKGLCCEWATQWGGASASAGHPI